MPVRLCFENKKTLSFSYTSNRFEFLFFSTLFLMVHCLFTSHFIMQINITFPRFKENQYTF